MGGRRAHADEYAERINRAVALLVAHSPAGAVRALQAEHDLSERQARRYVRLAQSTPDGIAVPERTAVFTVRLPGSLIAQLRAAAARRGDSVSATAASALRAGLRSAALQRERPRDGAAAR